MNLRPDLRRPLLTAWLVFAGVLTACLGMLWWLLDPGELPPKVLAAVEERRKASGPYDLAQRIAQREAAVKTLAETIERLKQETGFVVKPPFLVPPGEPQPGDYFNRQFAAVQDFCRKKCQDRSIGYQEKLGFTTTAEVPKDSEAPYLLTMLQLTRKAAEIVLSTPTTPVASFAFSQPLRQPQLTGPSGRDPLHEEYLLQLEVTASLSELLWILHQFAQRGGSDDYPLTVRRMAVDSANVNDRDEVQLLKATLVVAAMRFLSPEERKTALQTRAATSGGKGL